MNDVQEGTRLTIGRRLGLAMGVAALAMLILAIVGYRGVSGVVESAQHMVEVDSAEAAHAAKLRSNALELRRFEKDFYLNMGNPSKQAGYVKKWRQELAEARQEVDLIAGLDRSQKTKDRIKQIRSRLTQYEAGFLGTTRDVKTGSITTAKEGDAAIGKYKDAIRGIDAIAEALADESAKKMASNAGAIRGLGSSTLTITWVVMLLGMIFTVVLGTLITRSVSHSITALTEVAKQLATGNLRGNVKVERRRDEIGELQQAFSAMHGNMRSVIQTITEGIGALTSSASQIGSTAREYAATASEHASSVAEASATLGEVRQTSQSAAERARGVVDAAEVAAKTSADGQQAVANAVISSEVIGERVGNIAIQINELSDRMLRIGDIVESVGDLAEQSNLLAVNANIQAAKAGSQGRGFSVVASEVRNLAEQSKRATVEIRGILSELQRAAQGAVSATEEGKEKVADGVRALALARQTIEELGSAVDANADAARQIAASAGQQATGIGQVADTVQGIAKLSKDSAMGVQQLQTAAEDLTQLSSRLTDAAARFEI